jgi:hypothetical protein
MIGSPMRFMNPQISSPGRVTPLSYSLAPMNTTLRIDTASGAEAANQAPTITSAIIKAEQSTKEAISSLIGRRFGSHP